MTRKDAFVTVDAYRNNNEKEAMFAWNLTAKTILSTKEWKKVFHEVRDMKAIIIGSYHE